MGKFALWLTLAAVLGGGLMLFQSNMDNKGTEEGQAERQEMIVAREIARTGLSVVRSKALSVEKGLRGDSSATAADLLAAVGYDRNNRLIRDYEGGTYEAWVETSGQRGYEAFAVGRFGDAEHTTFKSEFIEDGLLETPDDMPTPDGGTTDQFELHAGFIDSMAGWCSAIYLEQWIPDDQRDGEYRREVDMVFDSGHNRDGTETQFAQPLAAGTQMNFILAVDQDCSSENQAGIAWNDGTFNHHHYALEIDAEDINNMQEGTYAMVEQYQGQTGKWRLRFEDQNFYTEEQYLDIKRNSYGDSNWSDGTWGGSGWSFDGNGLSELRDYGSQPDYSDQVFWIELEPYVPPEEEEDPA
jgi:hypothetical protein